MHISRKAMPFQDGTMSRQYYRTAILLLLLILAALAGCGRDGAGTAAIEGFAALDMPNDSGSGILLKWHPLDKSQRVIQYNIYRGHTPDSLFYLSKLEIDPDVGVMGDWLNYEDTNFNPLIEFETAPRKLTREKHQVSSGILYKGVPIDADVLGALLPHYDVLGDIKTSKYYNSSKKTSIKGEQGPETYAGFKLTSFNNLYANPIAGHSYYYCVVPVNETGRFLPASPVLATVPLNNRPDTTAVFYSVYLKDTHEFRFEWSPPLGGSDITAWQAWLMPKSSLAQFRADQKANAKAPDSLFYANWQASSILIDEMSPTYLSQAYYDKVDLDETGTAIPPLERLGDYIPVLTYQDYWQAPDGSRYESFQSAALGEKLQVSDSAMLPKLPDYAVLDKANDKGDNVLVSFGRPLAFVTQASFMNRDHTRMRVNYEISINGRKEISKIKFRFKDSSGKLIAEVKEKFPDKAISFSLPKGALTGKDFSVEIVTALVGEKDFDPDKITQTIVYDPQALRFNGGDVSYRGQVLNTTYYDIFSKNKLAGDYSPGMRIGALSRSYDHAIPLPSTEMPQILKYDKKTKLLLTDHHFTVAADPSTGAVFTPSFYKQETVAELAALAKEIKGLQAQVAPGDSLSDAAMELKGKLDQQKFILGSAIYKQAMGQSSDRKWRNALRKDLDLNSRSFMYRILATDGRGLWSSEDDIPGEAERVAGITGRGTYLHPEGEWFDKTKLATLIASILMGIMVVYALIIARRKDLYIRPIAGLEELDNAVGRATEMGRPVMFVPGWGTLGDPCTISAMMILNQIAKKTAEYDIRMISPHVDYLVLPLAQEMVQTAYNEVGRPDAFNQDDIFFVSDTQFAFCAAVNGITVREKVATIFYMGYFYAEALLMTETGNQAGAIQIAASDAITQIPFFITTCDYTLIGEEFYAASAYLSRNIELVSMLKAQDYFKIVIVISVIIGTFLSTLGINAMLNFLPFE
jgi:hypothetical protein